MDSIRNTLTERGARYGHFPHQAAKAQSIKACFRKEAGEGWDLLYPFQREALENIAHKLARIFNGDANYADSWHDIAGYAQLVADELNKPQPAKRRLAKELAQQRQEEEADGDNDDDDGLPEALKELLTAIAIASRL